MNKRSIIGICILIGIALFLFFSLSEDENCFTEERVTVRGQSLSPLINDGETVRALYGYYDCMPIQQGDIVLYHFSGNEVPIIKIVKAIPGDILFLQKNGVGYNILINGIEAKNSEHISYWIGEKEYKMLSLYINEYRGVVPNNTYLLLGNRPQGTLDSTRFGLVDKPGIIAKVEPI